MTTAAIMTIRTENGRTLINQTYRPITTRPASVRPNSLGCFEVFTAISRTNYTRMGTNVNRGMHG